jgi:hypothetical protein
MKDVHKDSWVNYMSYGHNRTNADWLLASLCKDMEYLRRYKGLERGWSPVHKDFRGLAEELEKDGLVEVQDYYSENHPNCPFACIVTEKGEKYVEREEAMRALSK